MRAVIAIHHDEIDGLPVVWRSAPGTPTLWLHGVPDAGELWTPFLERTGGVAPDLPGFGGSAKRGDLDYSIDGYADWLERFCALAGLDRFGLVMHDWGVVGLAFAQRAPERVERLVAIDVVPFLPGYRWHPIARVWRVPVLGEVGDGDGDRAGRAPAAAGGPRRAGARRVRPGHAARDPAALPLQPARACSPPRAPGSATISAPALVLHGARDRYIPARFADGLAAALGDGRVEHVPDAGPLAVARPARAGRPRRRVPQRLTWSLARSRTRSPHRTFVRVPVKYALRHGHDAADPLWCRASRRTALGRSARTHLSSPPYPPQTRPLHPAMTRIALITAAALAALLSLAPAASAGARLDAHRAGGHPAAQRPARPAGAAVAPARPRRSTAPPTATRATCCQRLLRPPVERRHAVRHPRPPLREGAASSARRSRRCRTATAAPRPSSTSG